MKMTDLAQAMSPGVGIRVIVDGAWGFAASSDLSNQLDALKSSVTSSRNAIENLLQQDRVLPMQVANHPERNKIYNCLGSPNLPLVDIGGPINLETGDVTMLCSDGLWGSVQEDELIDTCTSFSVTQAIPIIYDAQASPDQAPRDAGPLSEQQEQQQQSGVTAC